MRPSLARVIILVAASAIPAQGAVQAQEAAPGRFARIVVLAPKPDRQADFEAGCHAAADNGVNVTPVADFLSHGVYERLVESSRGPALTPTPRPRSAAESRYTWYRTAELLRYRPTLSYRP